MMSRIGRRVAELRPLSLAHEPTPGGGPLGVVRSLVGSGVALSLSQRELAAKIDRRRKTFETVPIYDKCREPDPLGVSR